MRLYQGQHRAYCGVDLHARTMYLCVLDHDGRTLLHRTSPPPGRPSSRPSRPTATAWSSPASACSPGTGWPTPASEHGIPFVLGHALDMRAIHGTKTKNDQVDSEKIAHLLRAGLLPQAYVYPAEMRATRDLLRRRGLPGAPPRRGAGPRADHPQPVQPAAATGKLRYAGQPRRACSTASTTRASAGPSRSTWRWSSTSTRQIAELETVPRGAGQGARPADLLPPAVDPRRRQGAGADDALRGRRHPPLRPTPASSSPTPAWCGRPRSRPASGSGCRTARWATPT